LISVLVSTLVTLTVSSSSFRVWLLDLNFKLPDPVAVANTISRHPCGLHLAVPTSGKSFFIIVII